MTGPLDPNAPSWYCIHTKPKSEHIAAAHLKQIEGLDDVFAPRISYLKNTRRGKVTFIEALFPCYIFARFSLGTLLRAVNGAHGVVRIVRFGDDQYIPVPDQIIDEWRAAVTDDAVIPVAPALEPGDEVEVVDGAMSGIKTVITRVIPAQQRIFILLEILGQEREVEVSVDGISKKRDVRLESSRLLR